MSCSRTLPSFLPPRSLPPSLSVVLTLSRSYVTHTHTHTHNNAVRWMGRCVCSEGCWLASPVLLLGAGAEQEVIVAWVEV